MGSFRPPRIILANGVFDIFHIGHLRHLEQAARMGDALIVSVTRNAFVNKGPKRPLYDELERLSIIEALRCVHKALLTDSSLQALEIVRPAVFVKGREYCGAILPVDENFCKTHGIEIRFTDTESVRPHDRLD